MSIQALTPAALRGQIAADSIAPRPAADGQSFGDHLERALSSTNDALVEGDQAAKALATGQEIGLHETMIAVEKADIAFRAFSAVKNKALQAYQEVMRMQM